VEFTGWEACGKFSLIRILAKETLMDPLFFHLHHPLFDAIILKQGAQLIHFQPKGEKALLWSAEFSTFQKGKAFRGGIPLCWPWFGNRGVPSHGFARIVEWNLLQHVENDTGAQLVFELRDSAITRSLWPYAFTARLEMNLGRDISLSLHVNAQKESTAAFHTYFTCNVIDDVEITGLGNQYNDSLQASKVCVSDAKMLHVNHAIDRIYTQPEATIILKEPERIVSIFPKNHSDIVVWNPWSEGADKLIDMQENDYQHMLCVETARISNPLKQKDSLHVTLHIDSKT